MKLKKGYSYKDGIFYNSKNEEVEASEAIEETPETPETPQETTEETEVEVSEETEVEVSEEVVKSLTDTVSQIVKSEFAKQEKVVEKDINPRTKDVNVSSANERLSREEKFHKWAIAHYQQDLGTARKMKAEEIKELQGKKQTDPLMDMIVKAAGSTSSLSPLLPPVEFIAEVFRHEDQFGVARQFADVRRTDRGQGIQMILGNDDIQVSVVGEGAHKPSKKLAYNQFLLTFRKGVGILPLTDELVEDSAINVWNDAVQRFARAYARKEDEFVFTDATSGIVEQNGVNDVFFGSAVDFDHINEMMYGSVLDALTDGRYYFHHTVLGLFQRIKDNEDNYIWRPGPNGPAEGTIWGRPYTLTQVMPSLQDIDAEENTPIAVYGNLQHVVLGERTMLKLDTSNAAIVGDPDEVDQEANTLNSWTNDLTSMRAVKRFNAKVKFPEAFSVLRAGTGS